MLLSQYFLPVLKEKPADAHTISHSLMLRSGMIKQQSAGIYTWLPLGVKVLHNVANIVRANMNSAGCIEVLMPCIQPGNLWEESGRLGDYGKEMLKFRDRHENPLLFGPTNEEMITDVFRTYIQSYKDLPKNLYQIQWKFRDEIRPRFGVMRAREFLMKDAYSFDIDKESAIQTYNKMYAAYMRTFRDLGLSAIPVQADSGPIGGALSQEFHVIAETGESTIYYDNKFNILAEDLASNITLLQSLYAAADEKHDPQNCPIPPERLRSSKGIEVGHIFYIGTKYSKAMNACIQNSEGIMIPAEMGCYGIGISRLIGAIIEANHDEKGIIWPASVAPFKVSIINLHATEEKTCTLANQIYGTLREYGIEALYDDTFERAGSKFATHDLIGSPWQIIIGNKKASDNLVEIKHRATLESEDLPPELAVKKVIANLDVR